MPLQIQYNIETIPDRLSINFIDTTGSYSSGNLGGYGTPNPFVGDIVSSQITITKRNGTTYSINPFPSLPTTDSSLKYSIPATLFGYTSGQKIEDGLYEVGYSVSYLDSGSNLVTATDSFYFAFIEGLKCCVTKLREKIEVPSSPCVECKSQKSATVSALDQLLKSICESTTCDKLDRAQEMIDYVQTYCNCNCTDCN